MSRYIFEYRTSDKRGCAEQVDKIVNGTRAQARQVARRLRLFYKESGNVTERWIGP